MRIARFIVLGGTVAGTLAAATVAAAAADFAGGYSGTYVAADPADEHGSWRVVVGDDGLLCGTARSDVYRQNFAVSGTLTPDGAVAMSSGAAGAATTFIGVIEADGAVSGTWSNAARPDRFHGSFEGRRDAAAATDIACPGLESASAQ